MSPLARGADTTNAVANTAVMPKRETEVLMENDPSENGVRSFAAEDVGLTNVSGRQFKEGFIRTQLTTWL